jgi:hypothetical protein
MKENELLSRAIHDGQYVLKYSGEKGIDLGSDVIASLVNSQRNADSLSVVDEAAFWASFTKATGAIKPATIESVKKAYTADTRIRIFSKSIRCGALCTPKRTMWFYCFCIFLCLTAIVFFQYFSYFGVRALERIDYIQKKYKSLPTKIEDVELDDGGNKDETPNNGAFDIREALKDELVAQSELLKKWNMQLADIVPFVNYFVDADDKVSANKAVNNNESEMEKQKIISITATYSLNAINSYIMPLLFGMLGSFIYIVRDLSERIKTESYVTRNSYGYLMRWPLGAVSGATIGYILKVDSLAAFSTSLTPFGVAFVMGYSVDVFFRIFDAVIDKLVPKSQQAQAPGK